MRPPTTRSARGWWSAPASLTSMQSARAAVLRRGVLVPALFVIASLALFVLFGVPYQRDVLAVWLLIGLLCFSLSDVRGWARGVVLEWLPFIAILIAYDALRGSAAHTFGVHYLPQIDVDKALFGG